MKKNISLFLVISLLMLSVNLFAKEKRGANLKIWKKDGRLIKGELIAVRENSLLVLDTEGKDVNIEIHDITFIGIKRKSKALKGFVLGTLIYGASHAILFRNYNSLGNLIWSSSVVGGSIGVLIRVLSVSGVFSPKYKIINLAGMSPEKFKETLDKLRKKARIRDYK